MRITTLLPAASVLVFLALPFPVNAAEPTYDKSFLSDYSKLQSRESEKGTELVYVAPGAGKLLARYSAVMVDQPEVIISPDSDYKGAKPDDLAAVANMMRDTMTERLVAGGLKVAEAPGQDVLYVRLALTDLQLKRKKRGILGYTPVGAVLKAGRDATLGMMKKYDITNMTIQAELTDSSTDEVLAGIVAIRGGGEKQVRLDFEQVDASMTEFVTRLRCRIDNAKAPADKQVDCLAPPGTTAPAKH